MPLNNYAIIKARPIDQLQAGGPSPHYQVLINDGGVNYRIAINARSSDSSQVMFLHKKNLSPGQFKKMGKLSDGLYWRWESVKLRGSLKERIFQACASITRGPA